MQGWLLALRWSWPVRVRAYACVVGECGRRACVVGECGRRACGVCAADATGAGVARTEKANFS